MQLCSAALHFHHIEPTTKENTIAIMVNSDQTKEKILAEICANYHALEHYGKLWKTPPEGVEPSKQL
jgi:hypothetical protein